MEPGKVISFCQKETNRINSQSVCLDVKLLAGKNVTRPQLAFKDSINNSVKSAFIPKLTYKPHSLKPLSVLIEYSDLNEEIYSHPYIFEIDNLKLPTEQLNKNYQSDNTSTLDQTEMVFVDKKEQLEELIKELNDCTVCYLSIFANNCTFY